jgi:hypothetical protein
VAVRAEVGFDGANPQSASDVERIGENHYRVRPFSEDGDGNYKFSLNLKLVNDGQTPIPARVDVDWADGEYMDSRGFGFIGRGDAWSFVSAGVQGTVASYSVTVPPGAMHLGLSPAYGYGEYGRFADSLVALGLQRESAGLSEAGRLVEFFRAGSGPVSLLVVARYHPYETASSYCIEGLATWLLHSGAAQRRILEQCSVTLLPMPNPDGVHQGLCKRTSVGGVDLSHEAPHGGDATARVLLAALDRLAPQAYLDIHGWMYLEEDGLHYLDDGLAASFREAMDQSAAGRGNRWLGSKGRPDPSGGSLQQYLSQRFGTACLSVSYRWMGRTAEQMRALGGPTLASFAGAVT